MLLHRVLPVLLTAVTVVVLSPEPAQASQGREEVELHDVLAISTAMVDTADASQHTAPAPPAIALADLASATAVELCKANFSTCTAEERPPYATQAG